LAVDVTFDGPFNQEVTVWEDDAGPTTPPDPPRTDMLNWHWSDSASINAHEFGHMLGLYDEYAGGWQDPANPLNLADTLMGWGALTPNPTMRPEYFQQYLDYFSELNPYVEAELEQIPEPGALAIFVILCGAAVAWGRAARRR
jgi:hypothetical protein